MRKLLNTYFAISKREFNGLLVLVMLIVVIASIPRVYRELVPNGQSQADFRAVAQALPTKPGRYNIHKADYPAGRSKLRKHIVHKLFVFDPNLIGAKDWQKLGLSERQSAAIINYIAKGGKFRRAEDLQKMYTINDEMYKRLSPYVKIAQPPNTPGIYRNIHRPQKQENIRQALNIVEVNGADSSTLIEIRGIGPAFARRILAYRQRVGGFYKKEQLMEVYGLDSIKYNEIKDQVIIDPQNLRKIDINHAQIADFKGHPYIKYKQANALIQYRNQHGNYTDIADLSKVLILDAETINRLAPYIQFTQ